MQNLTTTLDLSTYDLFPKLSPRELDVLKLVAEGYTNAEIAARLYLSVNTVKSHISGILNKLGVNHRVQAAVMALRYGLL